MSRFGLFDLEPCDKDQPPFSLLKGPSYYDNPEGTDPVGKLWGANKYAIVGAYCATAFDVLAVSNVKSLRDVLNVAGFWFAPAIGCATAFASVTYIANDIRKKDDRLNYVLGALSCAPVLYTWRRCFEFTCKGTAFLMLCAYVKKDSIIEGYKFIYTPNARKVGNYYYDFSIVTEEWPKRPI